MNLGYEFGKIYKLTNIIDDKVYIGSTKLPLLTRFRASKK